MKEIWRDIRDYEGLYQVSNYGRVKSLEKIKSQTKMKNGYLVVRLSKDGHQTTKYVHILVAEAFLGPRPDGYDIDHIDHNRENNSLENIRYLSIATNRGDNNQKLNDPTRSKKVLQLNKDGELIREWPSMNEAQRQTGLKQCSISKCCLGMLKTYHGFIWRYL